MYQQLGPQVALADPATGWATANLCAVLAAPVEDVTAWSSDTPTMPGWGTVMDVDTGPLEVLQWLGQYDGQQIDPTLPDTEQRRQIKEARGAKRGRPSAIKSDVAAVLTGTQFVDLIENDGGDFLCTVVTHTAETPDPAAVTAALANRATKPLGVIYTTVITDAPILSEYTLDFSAISALLASAILADVT